MQLHKVLGKALLEFFGVGGACHEHLTALAVRLVDHLLQCFDGALFHDHGGVLIIQLINDLLRHLP